MGPRVRSDRRRRDHDDRLDRSESDRHVERHEQRRPRRRLIVGAGTDELQSVGRNEAGRAFACVSLVSFSARQPKPKSQSSSSKSQTTGQRRKLQTSTFGAFFFLCFVLLVWDLELELFFFRYSCAPTNCMRSSSSAALSCGSLAIGSFVALATASFTS